MKFYKIYKIKIMLKLQFHKIIKMLKYFRFCNKIE